MESIQKVTKIVSILKPLAIKLVPIKFRAHIRLYYAKLKINQLNKINIIRFNRSMNQDGINLIASIKEESGLGQSARLLANTLKNGEYAFYIKNLRATKQVPEYDSSYNERLKDSLIYNINLLHINPQDFVEAFLELKKESYDNRYNIAFWLWETEKFPKEWEGCFNLVDEIWTPSEFVSKSIRKNTNKPVVTMPYAVFAEKEDKYDRKYFHLPEDKFIFLTLYDSNSIAERKNPYGVLKAYKEAFELNEEVLLVIKINNATKDEIKKIEEFMGENRNYCIITDRFTKIEVNSLIACSDVLVSLHRAEGYGLVMAEAMILGTPCIATNWSANTEFMTQEDACLVDYKLIELKEAVGPYERGTRWAEPEIKDAINYMKKLYYDEDFYHKLVASGKVNSKEIFDMKIAADRINKRIREIYNEN